MSDNQFVISLLKMPPWGVYMLGGGRHFWGMMTSLYPQLFAVDNIDAPRQHFGIIR